MKSAFETLVEAMTAIVQEQPNRLDAALRNVSHERLFSQAVRHKCAGMLSHGIVAAKLRDRSLAPLLTMLKPHAQSAIVQSFSIGAQLADVVREFNRAGIQHALLKTGARLYAGDPMAQWTTILDLDVLVPRERAMAAFEALTACGYRPERDTAFAFDSYARRHHHLVPLVAPGAGKSVELHVALTPPGWFSLQTDWPALCGHFEQVDGAAGPTLRLDAFARALHMVLHGAGLYRIYDAVLLAMDLRADPQLVGALQSQLANERIQPIGTQGVLALAARMAGVEITTDAAVERFVSWTMRREALPAYLRARAQFTDAWFGNGGRVLGPSTRLAVPNAVLADRSAKGRVLTGMKTAGRLVTGLAAAGCPSWYRR